MITIYKITSPSNKIYIGQTKNVKERHKSYKYLACKGQPKLYNSLKKYGFDNHIIELIEETDDYLADEREIYFIKLYDSYYNGLNSSLGGSLGAIDDITKRKISETLLNQFDKRAVIVYQYDLEGFFIKKWLRLSDVMREIGCATSSLSKAIKNKSTCCGYYWSTENTFNIEEKYINKQTKKPSVYLYVYDVYDVLIHEKVTIKECALLLNIHEKSIIKHKDTSKYVKGYKFTTNIIS